MSREPVRGATSLLGKRLMVLGAGPSQLPGILKARAAGCRVVTVDPYVDSVGHAHSDERVECDTRDRVGVLAAASRLRIDGVCAFRSDVAVETMHHVRAALGLPGGHPEAASVMCHKGRFRRWQSDAGLPHPRFAWGESPALLAAGAARLAPPVWCKPVDNSGSRGITRIDVFSHGALASAIDDARHSSPTGGVCVEERARGVEVGGDAILVDGRLAFLAVTLKHLAGQAVTGHLLPALPSADHERVGTAIAGACAALGYRDGPLNFDAMVATDAVVLLEISPRNGGNGITDLVRHACGVDLESVAIHLALGRPAPLAPEGRAFVRAGTGLRVLGSPTGGRIMRLPDASHWAGTDLRILEVVYMKRIGDRVGPFVHNGHAVGHVVFRCDDAQDYGRQAGAIDEFCAQLFAAG